MRWFPAFGSLKDRPSFTHVSTHQTYVGKALYEHAPNCATIAAVACMSSSLLKSSLGPNLLALIRVDDDDTFNLFDKIFLEYNPHMQLTQKLDVMFLKLDDSNELIEKLKSNGPLFSSSLQEAEIKLRCLPLLVGFRALRSLTLESIFRSKQLPILKSLPSLSELKMSVSRKPDSGFFEALGNLENSRNLTSLTFEDFSERGWCSQGFQKDFCGRLLSKNRLTKLVLPDTCWRSQMTEDDEEAIVNAGMTNLAQLGIFIPARWIRGEGFVNLRKLSVSADSDEELVNIGNHCLLLEVLEISVLGGTTGAFLTSENLVEEAFKHLRELDLALACFAFDVGTGFSRLHSLEKIVIESPMMSDGSFLQHLPNHNRLRSISFVGGEFPLSDLHRFVNLEEIDLHRFQLPLHDIFSFAVFKQLKRIKLSECGEDTASSEPFRILCPQLPNLEKLVFYGWYPTRWTEEDVEAILVECKWLRELRFDFTGVSENTPADWGRISSIKKKHPLVLTEGTLQKKAWNMEQESGSRREREEKPSKYNFFFPIFVAEIGNFFH